MENKEKNNHKQRNDNKKEIKRYFHDILNLFSGKVKLTIVDNFNLQK